MRENIYLLIVLLMLGVFLVVFMMILLNVKNQNKILSQKRKMPEAEIEHQKALAHTLIISQEAERKRIGMDLHDEVGTALSALRMYIEQIFPEEQEYLLELKKDSKTKIDRIIHNVRRISHNLSPFLKGAYELKDALEDIINGVNASAGLKASIDFGNIADFNSLSEEAQLALYRVICELINNTIKHSGASELNIVFRRASSLFIELTYNDNGIGLTGLKNNDKGIGMMNIESRMAMMAAVWKIDKQSNAGFRMDIQIPG